MACKGKTYSERFAVVKLLDDNRPNKRLNNYHGEGKERRDFDKQIILEV